MQKNAKTCAPDYSLCGFTRLFVRGGFVNVWPAYGRGNSSVVGQYLRVWSDYSDGRPLILRVDGGISLEPSRADSTHFGFSLRCLAI